ncbi:glycoside hydrolase family 16 protein [Nonomuraea sp. NPDC049695]|uniref:glycoside hydrolase family 16 protein n=1 Tax=Nonomuraea sp. NPDC049695 TaxID=3154734 RepID=UPI003439AA72
MTCQDYWSARLLSVAHDLLPPPHGSLTIAVRARAAPGAGVATSMWTWGNDVANWPANGEIDVAEQLGREPDQVHTAIQCPTCHETAPPFGLGSVYAAPDKRPYADRFHTFAVRWTRDPDTITWFVDGRRADTRTPADTGAAGWVFDQPMFLLLSVRVGGPFVGEVAPETLPATALIDDVTVIRA